MGQCSLRVQTHRSELERGRGSLNVSQWSQRLHDLVATATPETTLHIRHLIDREVEDLRAATTYLLEGRNAFSPICRLPDELLTNIFWFCDEPDTDSSGRTRADDENISSFLDDPARRISHSGIHVFPSFIGSAVFRPGSSWRYVDVAEFPDRELPSFRQVQLPWIAVTQVCRRWRRVALGAKSLWTNIHGIPSRMWMSKMAKRCHPLPVTVDFDLSSNAFQSLPRQQGSLALENFLNRHPSRVANVRLTAGTDSIMSITPALFRLRCLETLDIHAVGGRGPHHALPGHLVTLHGPTLRKLYLTGCYFGALSKPICLPQLTHLALRGGVLDGGDATADVDATLLRQFLTESPELETLRLSYWIDTGRPRTVSMPPPLTMDHLTSVYLSCGTPASWVRLFEGLTLPSLTNLSLDSIMPLPHISHVRDLMSVLASPNGVLRSSYEPFVELSINIHRNRLSWGCHSRDKRHRFSLRLFNSNGDPRSDVIQLVSEGLPLNSVEKLTILTDVGGVSDETLFTSLEHLRRVRDLTYTDFKDLAHTQVLTGLGPHEGSLIFPALRHLRISDVHDLWPPQMQSLYQQFISMLRHRFNQPSSTLETLRLGGTLAYGVRMSSSVPDAGLSRWRDSLRVSFETPQHGG